MVDIVFFRWVSRKARCAGRGGGGGGGQRKAAEIIIQQPPLFYPLDQPVPADTPHEAEGDIQYVSMLCVCCVHHW